MNPNERIHALLNRANTLSNRIAALTTTVSAIANEPDAASDAAVGVSAVFPFGFKTPMLCL